MDRRWDSLVLVLFLLAALVVGFVFRYPLVTDDPYITFRYAQNLINGVGLVYNPGERVLSTTTPLFTVFLASLGLAFRTLGSSDLPALGFWTSVLALGICAYLLYRIGAWAGMAAGAMLAGVLTVAAPALVLTFGLETTVYLALALGAFYAYLKARTSFAFALLALLTLTRNDGVLLAAILAAHLAASTLTYARAENKCLIEALRPLLRPFAIYALLPAPWLLFAWFYFSSPFPFTLTAKVAQAQSGLWDTFSVGLVAWARGQAFWLVPLFLFSLAGCVWAWRARRVLLLFALWALLHIAAYSLLGVAFYPWYAAPLIPALALFAGIGAQAAARQVTFKLAARGSITNKGVSRETWLLLIIGAVLLTLELRADVQAGMLQLSPKVEAYRRAAEWIAQNTSRDASVDALEVGIIGYYNGRRTIDFVGLVDPTRIPYLRVRRFADGVRRAAADYVVAIPPDEWLTVDVWFKDAYQPVAQISVPGFYSNRPLVIYQRADSGKTFAETIPINLTFEKRIELTQVELGGRRAPRGAPLPLRLTLRALDSAPIPETWKFTIQLVGAENRIIAQTDNFYPARLPEDGKLFLDYQAVPIPEAAPPGEYDLILAMYDAETGERLALYDAAGVEHGDFLALGKVSVEN